MNFKNETLIKKTLNTVDDIFFNNNYLKENGYIENCGWVQKAKSYLCDEEFKELVNRENKLYNKLNKYKNELLHRVIRKDISEEEYKKVLDKIKKGINNNN